MRASRRKSDAASADAASAEGGFTFLEIVIVVMVLGIVAAAALPNMTASLVNAKLYAACSEAITAMEFAQMTAMTTSRPCRVTTTAATDTLAVEQIVYTKLSTILNAGMSQLSASDIESATQYMPVKYPMKPGSDYTVNFASAFTGVDITSVSLGAGGVITFDELGVPSAGGQVTLTCAGRQAVVSVNAGTGKVTRTT